MGKENQITLVDLAAAIIVEVGLGLGLYPVFQVLEAMYLWYLFSGAVLLIAVGLLAMHMKKYRKIGFQVTNLGSLWLILSTLLLCTWVQSPIIAVI